MTNRLEEQGRFGLTIRYTAGEVKQAPGLQVPSSALETLIREASAKIQGKPRVQQRSPRGKSVGRKAKGHSTKSSGT